MEIFLKRKIKTHEGGVQVGNRLFTGKVTRNRLDEALRFINCVTNHTRPVSGFQPRLITVAGAAMDLALAAKVLPVTHLSSRLPCPNCYWHQQWAGT
jgi:hypothetical protein